MFRKHKAIVSVYLRMGGTHDRQANTIMTYNYKTYNINHVIIVLETASGLNRLLISLLILPEVLILLDC